MSLSKWEQGKFSGKETGIIMAIENCNLHERNSCQLKLLAEFFSHMHEFKLVFIATEFFVETLIGNAWNGWCLFKYFFFVCAPIPSWIVGTSLKLGFCRLPAHRSFETQKYIFSSSWRFHSSVQWFCRMKYDFAKSKVKHWKKRCSSWNISNGNWKWWYINSHCTMWSITKEAEKNEAFRQSARME